MKRIYKNLRQCIYLSMSAILFFEAPLWAAPSSPKYVTEPKRFMNKTQMGRPQTLKQWWTKAKPLLNPEAVQFFEDYVQTHPNEKIPAVNVRIRNTKEFGEMMVLNFKTADKVNHEFQIRSNKGELEFVLDDKVHSGSLLLSDLRENHKIRMAKKKLSASSASTSPSASGILSWEDFQKYAAKDYKWGIRYLKALQAFAVAAEKNQYLLRLKKDKKTSWLFDMLIPGAEAKTLNSPIGDNDDQSTTCIVAGWVVDSFNPNTRTCLGVEEDKKCKIGNKSGVQCNPSLFGKNNNTSNNFCVPIKERAEVSENCAKQSGLDKIKTTAAMKEYIEGQLKQTDPKAINQTMNDLLALKKDYINVCLKPEIASLVIAKPNTLKDNLKNEDMLFWPNEEKINDKHNIRACRAVLTPLQYLEELPAPTPEPVNSEGDKIKCDDKNSLKCDVDHTLCAEGVKAFQCTEKQGYTTCTGGIKPVRCNDGNAGDGNPGDTTQSSKKNDKDKCEGIISIITCNIGTTIIIAMLGTIMGLILSQDEPKDGKNGKNGNDGVDGKDGAIGPQGPEGKQGPPGGTPPNPAPTEESGCDRNTQNCGTSQ